MTTNPEQQPILERARRGDQGALGQLLELQRTWLHQMAQGEINGPLAARVSASDLVQQTCLSAVRQFEGFSGEDAAQFRAWLKGVHRHNIQDAIRQHLQARKRTVHEERSLDAGGSAAAPVARSGTPSAKIARDESAERLLKAIETLPASQATAVRLRHLEQKSLSDIAAAMDRTEVAVASLLKRGLEAIRQRLERSDES
ncbi:sigma-70 family RNA polymerase sigma factor [Maioricimonas sp. JC845]|uniref:sigma-70 family RNA polymerase sigma factor n=1 Tax=Maioricimonas sp. JC845 TaxID=3232138 RepID=UPI003459D082